MKIHLIIFLLLCNLAALSQTNITTKRSSSYSVNLTFTPQLLLNQTNVENDGVTPETISTKNTGGYTFGAEIERKSKIGFLLNVGLQYGMRHHSIMMGYENLGFFEPSIAEELNKLGSQTEQYSGNSSYLKLRFMVGYVIPYKVLHGCNIEIKAGVSISTYLTEFTGEYYRGIELQRNDTIFLAEIGDGFAHFGDKNKFQSWGKTAECYVGLRKELNTKYLKNISIGLEFTRAIFFKGQADDYDVYMDSYTLYGGSTPVSTDKYISKDFSIGIRLSAGLWHK